MGRPRKEKPRDPWAVKIGARLREAREDKKWTLKAMSAAMGGAYSEQRIGNYEMGDRMLGPQEALALAKALGDSPAYLLCLVDEREPQIVRNSTEGALLELFRTVDPEQRDKILERLGALALLKKAAVEDAQLEHLSAKGKPRGREHEKADAVAGGSGVRKRSRRSETERRG